MSSARGHDVSLDLALRALAERCDGPEAPASTEVEAALERGFAALISLEARLQRLLHGGQDEPESSESLTRQIHSLRSALEDLRERTAPERTSPLALGFVLPTREA